MDRKTEIVKRFNETKTIGKDDLTFLIQEMHHWKHKYNSEVETLRRNNREYKEIIKKQKREISKIKEESKRRLISWHESNKIISHLKGDLGDIVANTSCSLTKDYAIRVLKGLDDANY